MRKKRTIFFIRIISVIIILTILIYYFNIEILIISIIFLFITYTLKKDHIIHSNFLNSLIATVLGALLATYSLNYESGQTEKEKVLSNINFGISEILNCSQTASMINESLKDTLIDYPTVRNVYDLRYPSNFFEVINNELCIRYISYYTILSLIMVEKSLKKHYLLANDHSLIYLIKKRYYVATYQMLLYKLVEYMLLESSYLNKEITADSLNAANTLLNYNFINDLK